MDLPRTGQSGGLPVVACPPTPSFSVSPLDLNLDLDLDLEQLWEDVTDISSPAFSASDHGHFFPMEPLNAPLYWDRELVTPSPVEFIFYPSQDGLRSSEWTGPDPLSPHTSADDIFLYMSAFLLFEQIQWIEFRLCRLITQTGEVVEEYPFFLPRVESILGNLARIRGQICDIILRQDAREALVDSRFQLCMWPWSNTTPSTSQGASDSFVHPALSMSALDPVFFLQNIKGNFST